MTSIHIHTPYNSYKPHNSLIAHQGKEETGWLDTHPSSRERFDQLLEQANEVNADRFSGCGHVGRMWGVLFAGKEN